MKKDQLLELLAGHANNGGGIALNGDDLPDEAKEAILKAALRQMIGRGKEPESNYTEWLPMAPEAVKLTDDFYAYMEKGKERLTALMEEGQELAKAMDVAHTKFYAQLRDVMPGLPVDEDKNVEINPTEHLVRYEVDKPLPDGVTFHPVEH